MERPELAGKWKNLKKDQILIGILVGVLLLVIAWPQSSQKQQEEMQQEILMDTAQQDNEIAAMEAKLQKILEQVEGVGRTQVMITVKSSGKKTVEKDTSLSEDTDNSGGTASTRAERTTVYQRDSDGNEIPFVIEETAPVIEGVLVAAQGGGNLPVAENIADAAEVLFGVEAHKIKVMKLN